MVAFAIETRDMVRTFGATRAVDGVSLQVPQGIIFGFLGPNGAGKTTTLRLLLGLLELDGGSASVLGYDVATQSGAIRERTGVLLEHDGLYLRLSEYDNLEYYGRIYHLDTPGRQARIQELLEHLGLWDRRGENVFSFSKGMRQKLAVARALLHRPSVIFLDEPSAGLDPVAAVALRKDIRDLASRGGATVFLTTHNLAEAEKVCDLVGAEEGRRCSSRPTTWPRRKRSVTWWGLSAVVSWWPVILQTSFGKPRSILLCRSTAMGFRIALWLSLAPFQA